MKLLPFIVILTVLFLHIGFNDHTLLATPQTDRPTGAISLKLDTPPPGITHVIAHLSRRRFTALELLIAISDSSPNASGSFKNAAAGKWHLRVDACDSSNAVRFTGETDVTVLAGETAHAELAMVSTAGSTDIHVTWGGRSLSGGLMLYMRFDGTLLDSSGNGNNGSSLAPEYTENRFGAPGTAYRFNGADNFIKIPNSSSLNPTNALTIAFWFKVDSVAWNVSQLISKTVGDAGNLREYVVELKDNYDSPYFKLWATASKGKNELDAGAAALHDWHHFVGIVDRKDSHKMKMYIDGILSKEISDHSTGFVVNSHPLFIGAGEGEWESASVADMAMDDLRIYSRALSAAEVQQLYALH